MPSVVFGGDESRVYREPIWRNGSVHHTLCDASAAIVSDARDKPVAICRPCAVFHPLVYRGELATVHGNSARSAFRARARFDIEWPASL